MPGEWPDPRTATDAGAFVEAMRQVRIRTGYSYRALERRAEQAGLVLPSSTISAALARDKLPRAELVDAFLKAAGADAETTERWLAVRADLASGAEPVAETTAVEPKPERRRLGYALVALVALAVVVVVIVVLTTGSDPERPAAQPPPTSTEVTPQLPPPQVIRMAHTGLCLGEGRELRVESQREVLGQHPCDTAFPPLSLERLPDDTVRILLQHPDKGLGCVTVDKGGTYSDVLLAGDNCEDGKPDQLFTLEPVDGGYRLHSVPGARWCIGVMDALTDPGIQLMQDTCTGGREQVFQIDGA